MTSDPTSKSPDTNLSIWSLAGSEVNMWLLLLFTMKLRNSEHPEKNLIGIFRFLVLSFLPASAALHIVAGQYLMPLMPKLAAIAYACAFVSLILVAPIDGFLVNQFAGAPGARGVVRPAIGTVLFGLTGLALFSISSDSLWDAITLWFAAFLSLGVAAALFRSAQHAWRTTGP